MHDITAEPDPLGRLLAPPPPPTDGALLRQRLLERTSAVLRQRRSRRSRLGAVAVLTAACFAGLLALRCEFGAPAELLPVAGPATVASVPDEPSPPTAEEIEWQALEAAQGQAGLYRQAGDNYLEKQGDVSSAVRCYGGALDEEGAEGLTISTEDSWLLMAIKNARQKEKRDAK